MSKRRAAKKRPTAVCLTCATKMGWRRDPLDQPTMWVQECDVCKVKRGVMAATDFILPSGKPAGAWD